VRATQRSDEHRYDDVLVADDAWHVVSSAGARWDGRTADRRPAAGIRGRAESSCCAPQAGVDPAAWPAMHSAAAFSAPGGANADALFAAAQTRLRAAKEAAPWAAPRSSTSRCLG